MDVFEQQVAEAQAFISQPRFSRIRRLYTARAIAEQQGTIDELLADTKDDTGGQKNKK